MIEAAAVALDLACWSDDPYFTWTKITQADGSDVQRTI